MKVGLAWSRHSFGTVVAVTKACVTVKNEAGKVWDVGLDLFADEFKTSGATDFKKKEALTRTALIEKFEGLRGQAVTVNFNKKLDHADLIAQVARASTVTTAVQVLKANLNGEERTMVGYHFGSRDGFGRIHFTEMGQGGRLVDPRTINWFVADDTMYSVKP